MGDNEIAGLPALTGDPEHEDSRFVTPTGMTSDCKGDGIIELSIPNLLPTDNVQEERTVPIERVKIPVRIDTIILKAVDNGFTVKIPNAGRQAMFGPDGSRHVFLDKTAMLEFIGSVIGQVTYQYQEREAHNEKTVAVQADGG